jgi:hypothetical protein
VDRALTPEELAATSWLLEHGTLAGRMVNTHLRTARVCARCACGCGSVDFRILGLQQSRCAGPIEIVSDYWWRTNYGHLCGASVYIIAGTLTGLDLWSIDGLSNPATPPNPSEFLSYDVVASPNPFEGLFARPKQDRQR